MEAIAWVISLAGAFFLGYKCDKLMVRIKEIERQLATKIERRKTPEETQKSMVIDAYDQVQQAKYEHDQLMKKLNGES